MIDVHAHLAALPTPKNGCKMSRKIREGPLVRMVAWSQGLSLDDPEGSNRNYIENFERELKASKRVDKAVVLGLDGAYDSEGRFDEERTNFLISNDAVFSACEGRSCFLPGPSVNPQRRDAIDELERCAAQGAVLIKVLANAQCFDPSEPRYRPFYKALARLKLPLLSHVGYEFALVGRDQSVGDPLRLIPALEEGVSVIAAHGGSMGLFLYEKYFPTMLDLFKRYPDFYADVSALSLPNRMAGLWNLRRHPEVHDRLLFGTDYPLGVYASACFSGLALSGFVRACRAKTRFDKQAEVLESLGIHLSLDFLDIRKAD
jgi:predicted TIM-barrel fold metal-dependent hydrolase